MRAAMRRGALSRLCICAARQRNDGFPLAIQGVERMRCEMQFYMVIFQFSLNTFLNFYTTTDTRSPQHSSYLQSRDCIAIAHLI